MPAMPDGHASHTSKNRSIPFWGIPLLTLGLAFSTFVLALIGGDALASGYWGWGMMWGVAAFILLGTTFFISRLASPEAALVITGVFWVVIVIGGHWVFYEQSQNNVYRWSQSADSAAVPAGWKQMDRESVYRAWVSEVLGQPDAGGWWDHLRANATAGLSNYELAMAFIEGQPGKREVHRTGWRVWAGWISSALFAALGCVLAIAGAAVWGERNPQEAQPDHSADQIADDFGNAVRDHDRASPERIQPVVRRPEHRRPIDIPIESEDVARLLPTLDEGLLNVIQEDLDLNRQWNCHYDDRRALSGERLERAQALIARYYDGDQSLLNPRTSWLLVLIAADRLREARGETRIWSSLNAVYGVLRALGLDEQLPKFRWMDLRDLSFERIQVGPEWQSLASGETAFYVPQSGWPQLAELPVEEIPRNAYPAIVHQACSMPDPRLYEGWDGVDPGELADRLGPRLRDALLTYIAEHQPPDRCRNRQHLDSVANLAATWPFEIAAPILERALQAGWRQSVAGVPETSEWKALLGRYDDSPFGTLRQEVKWYITIKREEVRRATGKHYVGF